jgi:hypothetical protein
VALILDPDDWFGDRPPEPLPRECNDNGDGGICTHCGRLHTVTIIPGCPTCGAPMTDEQERLVKLCIECQRKNQPDEEE